LSCYFVRYIETKTRSEGIETASEAAEEATAELKPRPDLRGLRPNAAKSQTGPLPLRINWNQDPIWGDWDLYCSILAMVKYIETKTRSEGIETLLLEWLFFVSDHLIETKTRSEGIETKGRIETHTLCSLNWNQDPIWGDWDSSSKSWTIGSSSSDWNQDPIWGDWDLSASSTSFTFASNIIETKTRSEGIETFEHTFCHNQIDYYIETKTRSEGIETSTSSAIGVEFVYPYWNQDPIWGDWDSKTGSVLVWTIIYWNQDPIWGDWDLTCGRWDFGEPIYIETKTRSEGIETEVVRLNRFDIIY